MTPIVLTAFSNSAPLISVELSTGPNVVGRSPECRIVIPHRSVSRRHASVSVAGDSVIVSDLRSRNGTFVDGRRVQHETVKVGQSLVFGSIQCAIGHCVADCAVDEETASRRDEVIDSPTALLEGLTAAQRRVFDRLIEGDPEKEIARRLRVSAHTVHTHVRAIYRQIGVHSRAELSAKMLNAQREVAVTTTIPHAKPSR